MRLKAPDNPPVIPPPHGSRRLTRMVERSTTFDLHPTMLAGQLSRYFKPSLFPWPLPKILYTM